MGFTLQYTNIRKMEPLLTKRLRLAFPEKTFAIERVPQVMTVKEFERLARLSPFIGLAWVGFRADANSGRMLSGRMLWRLILIFKASNGLETRFKGDVKGIGLDAMADVAIALMHGWTVPDAGPVSVTGANSVIADGWSDEAVVIAQVDFEIYCTAHPGKLDLITPDDFRALSIDWMVEPDPDAVPVSDTLTLDDAP
ncbi:hypothetical protein [Rhizobium sp. SL86]|uniref:hypothetical protein n=1 Tax=Rhizobium sp. SL86 TaxID=2995148 RepID=UPI0022749EE7|nr:hypothetical protein [Rhizobium sp. SL86]MCY1668324.1 hypothetical protein [Rhizobium sp. SL86]MCY1669337.1 hypothetical protein [Rhizobium sp. SL86]